MRFSILGFRQSVTVEKKITIKELVLLRWFIDFFSTGKMKYLIFEKSLYFWVDRNSVIRELPILGITNTSNVRRLLREMVCKKILHHHVKKGCESYYRLNTGLMSELLCSAPRPKGRRK